MGERVFNTPFELSLHILILLDVSDVGLTLDRMLAYDFMTVYSDCFGIVEESLNGDNIFLFSEISSRRNLIKKAVKTLVLDRLIRVENDKIGFLYFVSKDGRKMSEEFKSEYASQYRTIARSVIKKYSDLSDVQLIDVINKHSIRFLGR